MKIIIFFGFLAFAYAANDNNQIPIVKQASDILPDGSYQYNYETGNGIKAEERGTVKNAGGKDPSQDVAGSFEFTAPDGVKYAIQYVSDENGFQPQGAHLPVAPEPEPIPAYIQRALEWIAAHPYKEEPGKKF